MSSDYDITGKIGVLYPAAETDWPMYSFARASYMWNAIGEALTAKGWTEQQVKEWLQAKQSRWALDGDLGAAIQTAGTTYAQTIPHL